MILVILGILAFSTFWKYTIKARDTKRIQDTAAIDKSLELVKIVSSTYPTPSDYEEVTYGGRTVWSTQMFLPTINHFFLNDRTWSFDYQPSDILLSSWGVHSLSTSVSKINFMKSLQLAYSGTTLSDSSDFSELLNTESDQWLLDLFKFEFWHLFPF